MADIKAFLAHSFNERDKELIGTFIGHLDSIKSVLPEFSWEHAQEAKPGSVSSKVLALLEGKNVFIGICTLSEYVTSARSLFRFNGEWKTSDWIIQEIGLAVGRGMKVIIFLENGVRKPGGLIGDIEYISFKRENPHQSFDSLLQMLGTFVSKEKGVIPAVEARPATSEKQKEVEEPPKNWEPQADWEEEEYDRAAFRAIFWPNVDNADDVTALDTAYRASPFGKGISLTVWKAQIEYLRMLAGKTSDFELIRKAAQDNPTNSRLLSFLAGGYREFGEHNLSASTYEQAAASTDEDANKLTYLTSAASQYAEAGDWDRSRQIVESLKREVADKSDLKYRLLSELRDLAKAEKNDGLELAILEQMVELRPSNISNRFSLAYKHSEVGNSDMALHHYLNIPNFERDSTTWNNLGVAYDRFQLRAKAVDAFRFSENKGEALAMCNLGAKLLSAGFFPEARAEVEKALAIDPQHKNIPELLKRLNDVRDEEASKLTETLNDVKDKAAFYRKLGEAVLKTTPTVLAVNWKSPEGALEVKLEGNSLRIFGTNERPASPLAGVFGGGLGGQVMVTHRIEYSCQVRGSAIFCTVKRSRDGQTPSLLDSASDDVKALMVLNEDDSEISVLERPDSRLGQFYFLTRAS